MYSTTKLGTPILEGRGLPGASDCLKNRFRGFLLDRQSIAFQIRTSYPYSWVRVLRSTPGYSGNEAIRSFLRPGTTCPECFFSGVKSFLGVGE